VTLRLATRRSALALAQARAVAEALGGAELVEVTTAGDRGEDALDKSRWVSELERALLEGEADVAVHSAKDVPGQVADGLLIAAVPPRVDPRDALCGANSLAALPSGARVGTSSLRRSAQLLAARDDLDVQPLAGNVDTRLRRLAAGEWNAIVIALAGLERLGRPDEAGAALAFEEFVPAPGQGALALQARDGDDDVLALLEAVDHGPSHVALRAERALCAELGAGCRTPIGAHAAWTEDERLELVAFAGLPDGSEWVRDAVAGPGADPEALGRAAGERMAGAGAADILARAEAW
jgi:hydroxymethylbilane synthase